MQNISNNFKILNLDIISKFNCYKKELLMKIKKITIFVKLKTNESDFLINFLVISKIIYFWFKQKITIFCFKKEYLRGSRNNLIVILGLNLKKIYIQKFLNYFKNIVLNISRKIDNSVILKSNRENILFSFSNLNYLLGLNINKYYKYNINLFILIKFKDNKNINFQNIYEKIFF